MTVQIDTTAENNGLRLVQQGASPSSPSAGHSLLYIASGSSHGGLYVKDDAGRNIGPFITGSAVSGISWNQIVNESGNSFANFSGSSGQWISDGTVIKQTGTAIAESRARYNTQSAIGCLIIETEVQIRSGGTARRAGLLLAYNGAGGTTGISITLSESSDQILIETDGVANRLTIPFVVLQDTWYTLRVVLFGNMASVYVNGILYGSANAGTSADTSFWGLFTYQAEGWFRNIRGWNPTFP